MRSIQDPVLFFVVCIVEQVSSAVGNHVELEGEVVSHGLFEVGVGRYGVIEIVERVQPFIVWQYRRAYHEVGMYWFIAQPTIK